MRVYDIQKHFYCKIDRKDRQGWGEFSMGVFRLEMWVTFFLRVIILMSWTDIISCISETVLLGWTLDKAGRWTRLDAGYGWTLSTLN